MEVDNEKNIVKIYILIFLLIIIFGSIQLRVGIRLDRIEKEINQQEIKSSNYLLEYESDTIWIEEEEFKRIERDRIVEEQIQQSS